MYAETTAAEDAALMLDEWKVHNANDADGFEMIDFHETEQYDHLILP